MRSRQRGEWMVRCAHCDAELTAGASWCLDCGHAVEPSGAGGETLPDASLQRFAGMALGADTIVDPGRALGPTALLRKARVSVGGAVEPDAGDESADDARLGKADTADPIPVPPPAKPAVPPPSPAAKPAALPPTPAGPTPVTPPPPSEPARPRRVREGDVPQPGEVVEGYVIEEEVGRGGMGRVYRATHEVTGQSVALKMLKPQVASDRVRERFVNEARLLARLEHENIVPLLGFVDAPRGLFIVMPFVRGITLEQMLRRQGRLPPPVAAELFCGVCAGVAYLHEHEMLHRDLKPGNIIVQSDGAPRLTDFGIAREIGAQGLTATGLVIGTAEYIAPELANGSVRDDPRSDQYSLACILYEMLVGQPPFRHPSVGKLLIKHIQDAPPPLRTIVPELPEALEAVVMTGLAKAPGKRFADARAFAKAVRDAVAVGENSGRFETVTGDALARPAPPATRARWPYVALGLGLTSGVAAGLWWWLSRP